MNDLSEYKFAVVGMTLVVGFGVMLSLHQSQRDADKVSQHATEELNDFCERDDVGSFQVRACLGVGESK